MPDQSDVMSGKLAVRRLVKADHADSIRGLNGNKITQIARHVWSLLDEAAQQEARRGDLESLGPDVFQRALHACKASAQEKHDVPEEAVQVQPAEATAGGGRGRVVHACRASEADAVPEEAGPVHAAPVAGGGGGDPPQLPSQAEEGESAQLDGPRLGDKEHSIKVYTRQHRGRIRASLDVPDEDHIRQQARLEWKKLPVAEQWRLTQQPLSSTAERRRSRSGRWIHAGTVHGAAENGAQVMEEPPENDSTGRTTTPTSRATRWRRRRDFRTALHAMGDTDQERFVQVATALTDAQQDLLFNELQA